MTIPVFTWRPLLETPSQVKFNTVSAQFGDGYKQSVGLGINNKSENWDLTFKDSKSKIDAIAEFLNERQGSKIFSWQPKNSTVAKYFECSGYRLINHNNGIYTLSATFEQRFLP